MRKEKQGSEKHPAVELLKDLFIVELAKAGVPQSKIRNIVGLEMSRVSRIARYFKRGTADNGRT